MEFFKYQGTGNDFILIDNRNNLFQPKNKTEYIKHLCDRKFGIGADGLMLLESEKGFDFKMIYFNSDGNESTMCGNGGRCIVMFAKKLNIIENSAFFNAIDGTHYANIENGIVKLQMSNVSDINHLNNDYFLNTGSPHYIQFLSNIENLDVLQEGRKVRFSEKFKNEGTNVNFVEIISSNKIKIRTYERGVEDETLSCGTGVTAAAIVHGINNNIQEIKVSTLGGELEVSFEKGNQINNIWLKGPAQFVFKGQI